MNHVLDMSQANLVGYAGALLVFVTFWMKTMVPLRYLGIGSNIFFIAYGYLAPAYPPLVLHVLLLPLNIVRLREMRSLIKQFTSSRLMNKDEFIFSKGETADALFFVVSGRCRLIESGIDIAPGAVVGEFALISPDKTRTQTLQCKEAGKLLEITYGQVNQLYYQNPTFGFFFLQLISRRLFENIKRLESEVGHLRVQLVAPGSS